MKLLLQLLVNGIVNGALYAMLAVGFGLVLRSLRVFHVAYGGLFVAGAYCFKVLSTNRAMPPGPALLLTMGFAVVLGWLCERAFYRPLTHKRSSGGAILIASLGIYVAIENVIALVFGNELQTVSRGITRAHRFGFIAITEIQILQLATGIFIVGGIWVLVRHLRTFKALWAMGDRPELIPVLGLPENRLRTLVLVLSTTLAVIPASLICLDIGMDPHAGMSYLLIAAVAVLVGGVNSYGGWVAGAVALALLQSFVVWKLQAQWMDLFTFVLLVAMLLFRPRGLVDQNARLEETA